MLTWFSYQNDDQYVSHNVVYGDPDDMDTWTECIELQNETDATTLATMLNKLGAGPFEGMASTLAPWQEHAGNGIDIRMRPPSPKAHPGDSARRSSIR